MGAKGAALVRGFRLPFEVLVRLRADAELGPKLRRHAVLQVTVFAVGTALFMPTCARFEPGASSATPSVPHRGANLHWTQDDGGTGSLGLSGLTVTAPDAPDANPAWSNLWEVLGGVLGILKVLDWLIAAVFREHTDALTRAGSLLLGTFPEEAPAQPRLRFSLRWAWGRALRQLSGAVMAAVVLPVIGLAALIPIVGQPLSSIVGPLWGLYWLAVLTVAKSGAAWEAPAPEVRPWFLRSLSTVTRRRFTGPLRLYERVLQWLSRRLVPPALAVERAPWAVAGLLVARLVASLPVLSFYLRPTLPIAASAVLEGRLSLTEGSTRSEASKH